MILKKTLYTVSLIVAALGVSGCNNSLIGTHSVKNISEIKERKEYAEDWLTSSTFISKGNEVQLLSENGRKNLTVTAPPEGSIFSSYQDIASDSRDGFYNMTSTSSEAQYLQLIGTACEWLDCNSYQNEKLVADRLIDKIKKVEFMDFKGLHSVIHRTTIYDYEAEQWVEENEMFYLEDMISTANGLLRFSKKYNEPKYADYAYELLDTIVTLQDDVIRTQEKTNLHGGLYTKSYLNTVGLALPSYDSYSLSLSYELSEIEDLVDRPEYEKLFSRYKKFIQQNLLDIPINENTINVALNGRGELVRNEDFSWRSEVDIPTDKMFKAVSGIANWYPNEKLIEDYKVGTIFTSEMSEYGISRFRADPTVIPNAYYIKYLDSTNPDETLLKDWIMHLMSKQDLKGTVETKGAWLDGTVTNTKATFEIIKTIAEVYSE